MAQICAPHDRRFHGSHEVLHRLVPLRSGLQRLGGRLRLLITQMDRRTKHRRHPDRIRAELQGLVRQLEHEDKRLVEGDGLQEGREEGQEAGVQEHDGDLCDERSVRQG